ncbi:Filament-forming protein [Coemansia sp. RSA 1807]|nr:Filament-forming protein [Coemansia sp. RSA 1807]
MEVQLSQLLGVPKPSVSAMLEKLGDLNESNTQLVLARIQEKLSESSESSIQQAKAQVQYENTRLENEVHRLNKGIGQLKSQVESANGETKAAQTELQAAKVQLDKVQTELQTQRGQTTSAESQMSQLREQMEQLREEKRELLQQIAERRDQLDDRTREVNQLSEITADLRAQRAADQDELARLRSQVSVSDVGEHMLKQSLELAKNQVKWLDEELVKTQTEMQQARTELGRASTTGKAECVRLRGSLESLSEQLSEASQRTTQLERRLREKLESERQLKEELAEQAEQFRHEMSAQKKLCEEWEKTTEAAKQHVRSVEASLHELESSQYESEQRAQEAVEIAEQRALEAEQARSELQTHVERLEAELRTANQLLSETQRSQSQLLSPTARAASRVQSSQGNLNITQLYTDKMELEDRLKSANAEIASLRQGMEQILAEIEERGPIIAAEREEYQRLLTDADRIAQDLAHVRQENIEQGRELKTVRKEADLQRRQLEAEQQQARDTSRQVARMLRAVEEARTGGRPMPETNEGTANPLTTPMSRLTVRTQPVRDDDQWLDSVDQVISQKLVTFANITELVDQNRRLLRISRELGVQSMQNDDDERDDEEVKAALEQAEEMLDRMTAELETTRTRLGVVERERDMLKAMGASSSSLLPEDGDGVVPPPISELGSASMQVSNGGNAQVPSEPAHGNTGELTQLQSDFDTYKSETRKTRAQLEQDASKLQAATSELRVRAAKAEAQTQFDAERIQMFTRDLSARQKEVDHLRVATSRLHGQVESYERQLEAATQEMGAERVELSQLRRQTAILEAERTNMLANEQRWHSEELRLVAERASLTQILENTTRMRDEWLRASDAQTAQTAERLESARAETESVRQELKQARDDTDRARFRFESELRELRAQIQQRDDRIVQLQAQATSSGDAQTRLQGEKLAAEAARDQMQRQVAALEAQVQRQNELVQRVQQQQPGQTVTHESLVTVQLQDVRSQLETLQSELETTRSRADDFRQLSTANEAALRDMTETYDRYKAECEQTTEALRAKTSELERKLETVQSELDHCRSELDTVSKTNETQRSESQARESALTSRVSQLEGEVELKTKSLETLRADMARHESSAQGLQEQYEREIVAHAKDIESTLLAREKLHETQKLLAAASAELEAGRDGVQRLRDETAKATEQAQRDVQAAEEQMGMVRRQNALLLAHLESLGHQVPDVTADPEQVAVPSDQIPEGGDSTREESGLRDVVVYLRRERDLATAQLELAQHESQRWRQQSTHTQRMLDEARNELLQYAPADSGTQGTASRDATVLPPGDGPIMLTAAQRQSCRQQLEQATLLRESNTVLRTELTTTRDRLHDVESELSNVRDQQVPQLRSANSALQAELEAARDRVVQLQEMCDRWKLRHEQVLAKYQMIDPEEFNTLKNDSERQRNEVQTLREQSKGVEDECKTLRAENQSLQKELDVVRGQAREAERQAQDHLAKFTDLRGTFQKLRQQSLEKLKTHEATIQALNAQIAGLESNAAAESSVAVDSAEADNLRAAVEKLRAEVAALAKEKDAAVAAQQELTQSRDAAVAARQELEVELQQARAALDAAQAAPQTAQPETTAEVASDEVATLRSELAAAESKATGYEQQLEAIKAKALKYARDNRVLQNKAASLDQQLQKLQQEASNAPATSDLQAQLAQTQAQLAESEAKIEAAQANAKRSAELRSKLQVSRATKRADDLEKQVAELQNKLGAADTANDASLKRSLKAVDGPAKKPHVDSK